MHQIYYTSADTRVHYLNHDNAAQREVQNDRLAALAESAQPHKPRIHTRIVAYLREKLNTPLQPEAASAAEPIRSAK